MRRMTWMAAITHSTMGMPGVVVVVEEEVAAIAVGTLTRAITVGAARITAKRRVETIPERTRVVRNHRGKVPCDVVCHMRHRRTERSLNFLIEL